MKPLAILTSNIGQTLFLGFSLLAVIAFSFYVGAKFGTQLFSSDGVHQVQSESILPIEISDKEIIALTEEIGPVDYHFHNYLEKQDLALKKIIAKKKNKPKKTKKPKKVVEKPVQEKQVERKVEREETPEPSGDLLASLLEEDLGQRKYTLILGSFNRSEDAQKMKKKFKQNGYSVWVDETTQPNGRNHFEVRIGRYDSKAAAQVGAKRMQKLFRITPVIVTM